MINEKDVKKDFNEYLKENEIKSPTFHDVNNYLNFKHYDILDSLECDQFDQIDPIKEEIENIIYNNFNIDTSEEKQDKIKKSHFFDDMEKINDMIILSKKEFLESYSYITAEEYDNTKYKIIKLINDTNDFIKKVTRK